MSKDWKEILKAAVEGSSTLAKATPQTMKAFGSLVTAATTEDGALEKKTKELMATAIAICIRCEGCIAFHINGAIRAGATREEVCEMISVAVEMGGGPSTIYGYEALEAFDQLSS